MLGQDPRLVDRASFEPFPEVEEATRIYIEELKNRRKLLEETSGIIVKIEFTFRKSMTDDECLKHD